ncbi:hypothetical protein SDC9_128038 [bioreactor metagenome]|uniref:Uncharacterized protein n=1 Tax=bioreactor metagenome TaxID=1076179 RepID=A0A645CVP5_9ZZZZ
MIEHNHGFFRDAGKVIVECTAVNDILCRFIQVDGVIHQHGGIARARSNGFLPGGENSLYNTRTACCAEHTDLFVLEHDLRFVHGGVIN